MVDERNHTHPGDRDAAQRRSSSESNNLTSARLRCSRWESFLNLHQNSLKNGRMLLRMTEPPPRGRELDVVLSLPDGEELELSGTVIKTAPPIEGEDLYRVGLALVLNGNKQLEIQAIVERARLRVTASFSMPRAPTIPPPPVQKPSQMPEQHQARSTATPSPRRSVIPVRSGPIIGIDFGTSYCSLAYMKNNTAMLIPDESGRTAIPAIVWFRGKDDYVVGFEAREKLATDPTRTIPSIKRLLGCRIDDESAAPVLMSLACPGYAGPNRSILFEINEEQHSPVMISTIIFKHLKKLAEASLKTAVERAVLAYPLAFNEPQRSDLEKAARLAGIELAGVIPEPMAAAMAFGKDKVQSGIVGVYDFGGGTFDFCAMTISDGSLAVSGAGGDPWLGGDDLDLALAGKVADAFWKRTNVDLRRRVVEWQKIRHSCEEAKVYLSLVDEIDVFAPEVAHSPNGPLDLNVHVTREEFDILARDSIDNSISVCQQTLEKARIDVSEVTDLVLTGGTTKVPAVREAAQRFFGQEPSFGLHPEQAVVLGAAVRAAELEGRRTSIHPAEPLKVLKTAQRTIGISVLTGETTPLIHTTTPVPAHVKRVFATTRDGQSTLALNIVEDEQSLSASSRPIGGLNITGLKPMSAGKVRVEVTFELNEMGTLHVTARDLFSGRTYASSFELGRARPGGKPVS